MEDYKLEVSKLENLKQVFRLIKQQFDLALWAKDYVVYDTVEELNADFAAGLIPIGAKAYVKEGSGMGFRYLTQAQYDALPNNSKGKLNPHMRYYITDVSGHVIVIDNNSTTSDEAVWSAKKTYSEISEIKGKIISKKALSNANGKLTTQIYNDIYVNNSDVPFGTFIYFLEVSGDYDYSDLPSSRNGEMVVTKSNSISCSFTYTDRFGNFKTGYLTPEGAWTWNIDPQSKLKYTDIRYTFADCEWGGQGSFFYTNGTSTNNNFQTYGITGSVISMHIIHWSGVNYNSGIDVNSDGNGSRVQVVTSAKQTQGYVDIRVWWF